MNVGRATHRGRRLCRLGLAKLTALFLCAGCAQDPRTVAAEGPAFGDASRDAPGPDVTIVGVVAGDAASEAEAAAGLWDATSNDGSLDAGPAELVTGCAPASQEASLTRGDWRVVYNLGTGTATFSYAGAPKVVDFYAKVQLDQARTSQDYAMHVCMRSPGGMTITSTGDGLPVMNQTFRAEGANYFLTQVTLQGVALSTNWTSPLVVGPPSGKVDIGSYDDARALVVPFDNDDWVRYEARPMNGTGTGYEVGAFYDNTSRQGIVVGSVTHDTWKTGVSYVGQSHGLAELVVFGGIAGPTRGADGGITTSYGTHDVLPHGRVTGDSVASPVVFVGFGPDWRDLLVEYADANAAQAPMLEWAGGVPFGWNSWGKIQQKIDFNKAIAVSDFFGATLQPAGFSNSGTVYVNLDSYWDNLNSNQLAQFAAYCHAKGQKAGIYWSPFVDWGRVATRLVEGTASTPYQQIWLRDSSGNPIDLDGAYAVDPTHPATKSRIDHYLGMFNDWGYDYIKLDFLSHGALESSVRFDPKVQTGIQAFNQGMQVIDDKIGGRMFISESIAPLFPYRYAHARRVSCDTYGAGVGFASAEYELNSAAYGFWMSGRLYRYNDPDEMVFEGYTPADNMMRLVSAVVSGTVFLDGDDLSTVAGQTLAKNYLTNAPLNAVAALGRAFRPVEANSGTGAATTFVLSAGSVTYLGVFHFTPNAETLAIDLARAGLNAAQAYTVTDLWTGATSSATGILDLAVTGNAAKLLQLE
jgi:alpha-galactosidase